MPTPHIEAIEDDIAKIVLMPGDPKRCEFIANNFLIGTRIVNTLRGCNAYTGYYKNTRVTVMPSGMGISSMGIYSYELFNSYDVDVIIRIGTCGAYNENLKIYDLFLAESAYSNTTYDDEVLGENINVINSNIELNNTIIKTAERLALDLKKGRVHTSEAFYTAYSASEKDAISKGCDVVEMETYALLLNAREAHKKATSILTVTDELSSNVRMDGKSREIKLNSMVTLALESVINLEK